MRVGAMLTMLGMALGLIYYWYYVTSNAWIFNPMTLAILWSIESDECRFIRASGFMWTVLQLRSSRDCNPCKVHVSMRSPGVFVGLSWLGNVGEAMLLGLIPVLRSRFVSIYHYYHIYQRTATIGAHCVQVGPRYPMIIGVHPAS